MIEICGTFPERATRPPEDPAVAAERGDALLHPRAAGADEADDGSAGALRELEHADDRLGVRCAERAAGVTTRPGHSRKPGGRRSARRRRRLRRRRRARSPIAVDLTSERITSSEPGSHSVFSRSIGVICAPRVRRRRFAEDRRSRRDAPLEHGRAPGEAPAEGGEQHPVAVSQPPVRDAMGERQR